MKRQHGGVGARLALFEPQPAPQILHAMGVGPATSLAGTVWRGVACHFSPAEPGVMLASSGAEGLRCPRAFSGVFESTSVLPGPAVEGLSPLLPEGVTAASWGVGWPGFCCFIWDCVVSSWDGMELLEGGGYNFAEAMCVRDGMAARCCFLRKGRRGAGGRSISRSWERSSILVQAGAAAG